MRSSLRRIESAVLFILFIAIGALQAKHVHLGIVTSYGADVVCPAYLFVATRDGHTLGRYVGLDSRRPRLIALVVFLLCVAWEVCQRFHLIPGVFDPFDILAYALGVTAPLLLDEVIARDRSMRARDLRAASGSSANDHK